MRDKQSEAPVIADAAEQVKHWACTREEYERLLNVLEKVVDALDQCVGIYGKITKDLRLDIQDLRK